MERIEKCSLLVRVGATLSSLVLLGVSGLAYLLVADVYDTYPQLAYRAVFTVLGVLIPLPLAFFFGFVALRIRTLSLQQLMTSAARCMWSFFGLFLLTWLLEGLLIGEAPGPFMYVCVGTLILSATIARLLTLGARAANPGYRTKRVGFMVTFRLVGAEKSVLKLVGANLKDGQNVLVL